MMEYWSDGVLDLIYAVLQLLQYSITPIADRWRPRQELRTKRRMSEEARDSHRSSPSETCARSLSSGVGCSAVPGLCAPSTE